MAGSKTAFLSASLLDHVLGRTWYVPPATLWVGLSTLAFSAYSDGFNMAEVAATGYGRLSIANDFVTFSAAATVSPSEKHNLVAFTWPAATTEWGTPLSVYIADAEFGGNLLYGADLPDAGLIGVGDVAKVPASAFILEEV